MSNSSLRKSDKEIEEETVAKAEQILTRVFGTVELERVKVGLHFRANLHGKAVEILFDDVQENSFAQRIERYILHEIEESRMDIKIVSDKKHTGYASGTMWPRGCGETDIEILANEHIIGIEHIKRYGLKSVLRGILVHEVQHARIDYYLRRWLKRNGLSEHLVRKLDTVTEEFFARYGEMRALGHTESEAKDLAYEETVKMKGQGPEFRMRLEEAWKQKLDQLGIKIDL